MNEFKEKNFYEGYNEPTIDEKITPEEVRFEQRPENDRESVPEMLRPRERKVVADASMRELLSEALEKAEPGGNTSLVFIEFVDSEAGQRSACKGFDYALEIAALGKPLIIAGWQRKSDYAKDSRWHALMAYSNVKFVRLPFALGEISEFIEEEWEEKPFDNLAIRMLDIKKDTTEIQSLEHILDRSLEGLFFMAEWEDRARKIFGQEMSLDQIVARVRKKDESSLTGELEGEAFSDLCVDIEGTLIKNGEIDRELLVRMAEASKERPITIWTGGDLKHYAEILRKAGVEYKIASKHWLRGAKVFGALDDLPHEEFVNRYGIEVDEYEQIK